MKWTEKGNEKIDYKVFEEEFFKGGLGFYVFGAGDIGHGVHVSLSRFGLFKGFIDNDKNKQQSGFYGERVYSYDEFLTRYTTEKVIIAATPQNEMDIKEQLSRDNVACIGATLFLNKILPSYLFFEQNIMMMNLAQICLTERCSLKCEKCAHACYAVDNNSKDMGLERVKKTADLFFEHIDYIQEFVLIGGEPLLYKDLAKVVEYIGKKYRIKMGIFSITTNGTIMPDLDLVKKCKEYKVFWRISNYSVVLSNLEEKHKKIIEVLSDNCIDYYLGKPEEEWWDYGFDEQLPACTEIELINRFDECDTPCRETRDGKIYFCVMARTVSDNLDLNIGKDDYLDMQTLPEGAEGRRIFFEYNMGYSDKGYLSMCAKCRGKDCENYPVQAAKQAKR